MVNSNTRDMNMKMYIPEIGDSIKLTSDWTFDLYNEYRNDSVGPLFGLPENYSHIEDTKRYDVYKKTGVFPEEETIVTSVTLPAGTILKVDRIYIRKNNEEFSSLSFFITETSLPGFTKKRYRFWAKLADVNNMEFEIDDRATNRTRYFVGYFNTKILDVDWVNGNFKIPRNPKDSIVIMDYKTTTALNDTDVISKLRTKVSRRWDTAGITTVVAYEVDFKTWSRYYNNYNGGQDLKLFDSARILYCDDNLLSTMDLTKRRRW